MGMRIGGGYGAGWGNYQNTSSISAQQLNRKNLFSALQSGDLNAAQTAYTALQNQGIAANSPLNTIGQSLQSGDLAGAQKAAQSMHAGHSHRMRVNDGDADDSSTQAASASTGASSTSNSGAVDLASAFFSFMQNLETALEQQDPAFNNVSSTSQAAASTATPVATAGTLPSTQAVLWSKGAGFSTSVSDATLKADLDQLIQQLSQNTPDNASLTNPATSSQSSSSNTMATTANVLQTSFSTLLGSLGGQNSSVSVMSFLQSLDSSLSAPSKTLNVSA